MTPEEFRLQYMKNRGVSLTGNPIPQVPTPVPNPLPANAPIVPTPIQTQPIRTDVLPSPGGGPTDPTAPPVRMPSAAAVDAWRQGVQPPVVQSPPAPPVAAPPVRVPPAYPTGGADPIIATNPAVQQGPGGITLNSAPVAQGWAGTVGLPGTPEEAKAFDKGQRFNETMAGLEDVAKGLKPKAQQVAIPNLLAGAPEPNQANQMAGQLMAAMMNKNRGLTLTGR